MGLRTIIVLIYLGANVLIIGTIIYQAIVTYLSRDWPSTTGTVVSSRVSQTLIDGSTNTFPSVTYSYEVDGKTYETSVITAGDVSSNLDAEAVVSRYPPGLEVAVFYNPNNPSRAYLEKVSLTDRRQWAMLISVNILITIGVVVILILRPFLKLPW